MACSSPCLTAVFGTEVVLAQEGPDQPNAETLDCLGRKALTLQNTQVLHSTHLGMSGMLEDPCFQSSSCRDVIVLISPDSSKLSGDVDIVTFKEFRP